MSDLFNIHSCVTQTVCDAYAGGLVGSPVRALDWQGYYSYTVESKDGRTVVQFRSEESPLDQDMVNLAKTAHPNLVPAMLRMGFLDGSTVSVWKMEKIPGVGFLMMIHDEDIKIKMLVTSVDMAKFYGEALKCSQKPTQERVLAVRQECYTKLGKLVDSLPATLRPYAIQSRAQLDDIFKLPWVLTHDDLSSMNLLIDPTTGHLQSVIDWSDAAIWPFGIALWGLESILGYPCADGWIWLDDEAQPCRTLFSATLQQEMLDISADQLLLVEKARKLGLLLRYGFVWQDGAMVPTKDTTELELFLKRKGVYLPSGKC